MEVFFRRPAALAFIALSLMLNACVGPTTPFGAPTQLSQSPLSEVLAQGDSSTLEGAARWIERKTAGFFSKPEIRFLPGRQNLHQRSRFVVVITDKRGIPEEPDVTVLYNGIDVSWTFLSGAEYVFGANNTELRIIYENLRLLPGRDNKIEFLYRRNKRDEYVFARFLPPTCSPFSLQDVANTGPFQPSKAVLDLIHREARQQEINPSFLTGLIAQESGFDHRAISWARALGLTQVTAAAESEIVAQNQGWPRFQSINDLPFPVLKTMIMTGKINSKNEWRLNPEYSVRGGLTYLNFLIGYWKRPENLARIQEIYGDSEEAFSQIVLASYNSGFVRVGQALSRRKSAWITEPELREARKYINRVMSYCYHFAEMENSNHEDET